MSPLEFFLSKRFMATGTFICGCFHLVHQASSNGSVSRINGGIIILVGPILFCFFELCPLFRGMRIGMIKCSHLLARWIQMCFLVFLRILKHWLQNFVFRISYRTLLPILRYIRPLSTSNSPPFDTSLWGRSPATHVIHNEATIWAVAGRYILIRASMPQ